MKIARAEIFALDLTDGATNPRHSSPWHPVILRLTTDDGATGLGEAGLAYGVGHNGAVGMLRDFVSAFVIGRNPLEREKLWHDMQYRSFWGGASGPVIGATMSAIDIAMWDLTGKILGQPVCNLLGGRVQDSLRCYASQIQFCDRFGENWVNLTEPEEYAASAISAVEAGYDAVKVDPITIDEDGDRESPHRLKGVLDKKIVNRGLRRMEAIRDAVGPDVDIILELHSLTSLSGAQQFIEACAGLDLFMAEEAVSFNSSRPSRTLKQRMPHIRMTGGERIFTRWQFRSYLEDGSFDMLQPDFCLAGGISEGRKICDMAHAYEVTIQGHVCGSPISSAAAMHIETSIPNFQIHEHHVIATTEMNRRICQQDYQPQQGRFRVGDAPGLGLDLDEDYVRHHATVLEVA
ncbi:mandelate racemase/muconate lactonizing enzyme family protein [Sinisalibacter aestuarii]|uniref:Racemase n=1 Tax=Sinisalibacter aestuarii TaxID=2949426 RepID=A0ABQ5LS21_9RHOB|nr:mandelate racemase/muconate lactonizing enzyme family protein [Sinisalibacter aestuarii]GKY87041.1 racemase [Sinisalibacter aestuarii]